MPKSPLLEKTEQVEQFDYSEQESLYRGGLLKRLEEARNVKDSHRDEFDQMDYLTYFDTNEKLANTFIPAKKNKADSNFQSGTVRNKLFAFLSTINRMNLAPEILAFDNKNVLHASLGNAITEVLRKTEELENDDEKRLMRQFELLKQGTVFVEDIWKKSYKTVKKLQEGFNGDPKTAKWTEDLEEYMSRPNRSILDNRGVYLGSMNVFNMSDQPYIFTVDVVPYEKAKAIFGEWERWNYVPKKLVKVSDNYGVNWRLTEVDDNQVEIIKYQDKPNDEFQIILNGVMMLPVGYPLSAVSCNGEYTIVKQIFKAIRHNFPYGKSLCMELRTQVAVYDELLRLAVLKTQKSFMPPYANMTGQVLSSRIFMPGQITAGVDPRKLLKLDERDVVGVTNGEVAVIEMISQRIDESSVNKSYQGGEAPGTTLGEAQIAQQQSSLIIDLAMFSCSMLEKKLGELRVPMILKYWFDPIDTKLDEARGELEALYRITNVEASIPNRGMGRSMVVPMTGALPNPEQIYQEEEKLSEELGKPVRKFYINPDVIKKSEYIWEVTVNPVPRRGDAQQKLLFRAEMQDAMALFPQSLNFPYWQERFAENWGEDKDKAFVQQPMAPMAGMAPQGAQGMQGTPQISPQVNKVGINPPL